MINGRPLYPSSDELLESLPITPEDILIGQHTPPPQPEPKARSNPRHLLRATQNRVGDFWICWLKCFAPNLLPRNRRFKTRENVEVGDLVLKLDPNLRRNQWKMDIITETYPGNDGLVRKVRMKTKTGEYDGPIHKLCLIATKQELDAVPTMTWLTGVPFTETVTQEVAQLGLHPNFRTWAEWFALSAQLPEWGLERVRREWVRTGVWQ